MKKKILKFSDKVFPEGRMKLTHLFTIGIVIIIAFSLIIQLGFYAFFADDYYTNYKVKQIEAGFYDIKNEFDGTTESIEDIAKSLKEEDNINVTVQSSEDVYYSSNWQNVEEPIFSQFLEELSRRSFAYANYEEIPSVLISKDKATETEYLSSYGVFYYNGEAYYVDITLPLSSIESSVDILGTVTLWISIGALWIGVILAMIGARIISRPIRQIQMVTTNLASLNFGKKINEKSAVVEIHRVTKSINTMSDELETALVKLESTLSELNEVNEKLIKEIDSQKRIDEMRKAFVANVSHEMKTPLAILQLYAENLKTGIIEEEDQAFYFDTIIEETNNLNEMVVNMLDVSALENGFNEMNFEKFSISDAVKSLMTNMKPLMEDFSVEVDVEEDLNIVGDENYVIQAMRNYINNAISHTKKGEKIKVKLYSEQSTDIKEPINIESLENEKDIDNMEDIHLSDLFSQNIIFSVFNQGSKITDEDKDLIWDSFYRGDKARNRSGKNIGMGLHLVKIVMDKHYGEYKAISNEEGTEFLLEFKEE